MIRYLDINYTETKPTNILHVDTDHSEGEPLPSGDPTIAVNVGVPLPDGRVDWYGLNLGEDSVAGLIAQLQSWQRREVFCNE